MTFKSILVSVDLSPSAPARIRVAAALADRFGARLIGAAAEVIFAPAAPMAPALDGNLIEMEQDRVESELREIEALFRSNAHDRADLEWRSRIDNSRDFLVENARAADLIVLGRHAPGDQTDWRFGVNPGAVVLGIGKPILVVPPEVEHLSADRIVVAWKDTREARRAVWDSLPLLRKARAVLLVSVGANPDEPSLRDLDAYLIQHDVEARILVRASEEGSAADALIEVTSSEQADLLVAGAYGHSRMRESVFGGITRELLDRAPMCCLLSH